MNFRGVAKTVRIFAYDSVTGLGKTGQTAVELAIRIQKDASAISSALDFSERALTEIDPTNAPGWYRFTLTAAEMDADSILITGKSSTANVLAQGVVIETLPTLLYWTAVRFAGGQADHNYATGATTWKATAGGSTIFTETANAGGTQVLRT